ncbi:hypothetical protein QFC96_10635 (plasmid) [Latilactobacillus curvatus]|uniref:hypothetical protein n=1 Tax=Latilactobacillus curvatus TaxID=28038 RepID=UPI0024B8BB0D|nr:hypothetical protein [Latilactobacillus curvatus]WHQ77655.1 hypothetical protein QFC96_07080 [Latilactobacillus curvatus]WHQ79300.1 hypothetical protein QFC96_10635 [Latilactobacillus curvatus]
MTNKDIRVIRILSHKEIIINAGSKDGIKKETKFDILDSDGDPVKDLNGNILGALSSVKITIGVLELHDNFSIIGHTKQDTTISMTVPQINNFFPGNSTFRTTINNNTLNVDSNEIEPRASESSSTQIKVGDKVIIH